MPAPRLQDAGMKRLPLLKRPRGARRILDIGAGHNPFQGATHLLEIDIRKGEHRSGHEIVLPPSAKLVVGNVQDMPFRSGSFQFAYASHVLEHVDSPGKACEEIMRVAAAGYIETPSPLLEQGIAMAEGAAVENIFHKWFVFSPRPNLLVFEPKTPETAVQFCSCPGGQFLKDLYAALDFRKAQHCFRRVAKTTILYWTSSFNVEVRERTADCAEGRACRFAGMRSALVASCNDPFRLPRVVRFRKTFPDAVRVFRKHGLRTLVFR